MSIEVSLRADELAFGFADEAIDEGLVRSSEELETSRRREADLWVSAAFELVRRMKSRINPS